MLWALGVGHNLDFGGAPAFRGVDAGPFSCLREVLRRVTKNDDPKSPPVRENSGKTLRPKILYVDFVQQKLAFLTHLSILED